MTSAEQRQAAEADVDRPAHHADDHGAEPGTAQKAESQDWPIWRVSPPSSTPIVSMISDRAQVDEEVAPTKPARCATRRSTRRPKRQQASAAAAQEAIATSELPRSVDPFGDRDRRRLDEQRVPIARPRKPGPRTAGARRRRAPAPASRRRGSRDRRARRPRRPRRRRAWGRRRRWRHRTPPAPIPPPIRSEPISRWTPKRIASTPSRRWTRRSRRARRPGRAAESPPIDDGSRRRRRSTLPQRSRSQEETGRRSSIAAAQLVAEGGARRRGARTRPGPRGRGTGWLGRFPSSDEPARPIQATSWGAETAKAPSASQSQRCQRRTPTLAASATATKAIEPPCWRCRPGSARPGRRVSDAADEHRGPAHGDGDPDDADQRRRPRGRARARSARRSGWRPRRREEARDRDWPTRARAARAAPSFVQPDADAEQRERADRGEQSARTSSVNQLLSTALRIRKTTPSRVARPPIQASTRPPNRRSNSIRDLGSRGAGGGPSPCPVG